MNEKSSVISMADINPAYLENITLMKMNSSSEVFEYNALETKRATVGSVKEIYDDLIADISKYLKLEKPFTIGISSPMGSLKTTTLKDVFRYCIENDIGLPLYISPMNLINYQQLINSSIVNGDNEVIYKFLSQQYFVGDGSVEVDFKNITGDVIYSNMNHFRKLINLMKKNKKKFVVVFDECHIAITDYLFRNTNLSTFEVTQVMSEFERLLKECMDFNIDNYCVGIVLVSATMEPFSNSKGILFTKMYDLDIPDEKKIQVSLMEPLIVDKINMENIFNTLIRTLEKTGENSIQIINWNTSLKNLRKLKERLKKYQIETGNLKNIDFDKELEILHSDNIKNNETYESIKTERRIPKGKRIILATSVVSAGINIEEEIRNVDMTLFCEDDTFTKTNEVQIVGRIRTGVRLLQLVTSYKNGKNIMHYKTYVDKEKGNFIKEIKAGITFLNQLRYTETEELKRRKLSTYKTKNLGNVYNYINVIDNEFVISEFALMGYLFLTYNKEHVLTSVKGLSNAIYHHKALNVKLVREAQTLDFKDKKGIYEQISKLKPLSSEKNDDDINENNTKNEIKEIKSTADKELTKLLLGEISLNEATKDNQYKYNLLKTRDYKFQVLQQASLEDNKCLMKKIVKKYLKNDCSKTNLERELKEYKITLNMETVQKTKDKKSRDAQVKSLSTSDKDNKTAYHLNEILSELYPEDTVWSKVYFKDNERVYIYNRLLECDALAVYETEELIDESGTKKISKKISKEKYSGTKKQEKELKRCLSLCLNLRKVKGEESFKVSSKKKIKKKSYK